MRYTVTWLNSAEAELAKIWNQAHDKRAVSDAANRIDQLLMHDAEKKGYPLDNLRFLSVPPLTVLFEVSPPDCTVSVVEVHRK